MYLIDDTVLITRCSCQVLFFKLRTCEDTKKKAWCNYHTLDHEGFISFAKGNQRIQVTTYKYIYFYLMDFETYEPTLENVMFNFMQTTNILFSKEVNCSITYKTN